MIDEGYRESENIYLYVLLLIRNAFKGTLELYNF